MTAPMRNAAFAFGISLVMVAADATAQETPAPPPSAAPAPGSTPAEPAVAGNGIQVDAPTEAPPAEPTPVRPWTGAATLGAVSLPRVLSLEVLVLKRNPKDTRFHQLGFGAVIEYLPPGLAAFGDKTDLSWLQFGVEGRYFPWRWLYAGARLGWQFSRTDSEKFGSEVDYVTTSLVFAPKVGILHTFPSGLTMGGDLGAAIPFGTDSTRYSDGIEDSSARKASKTFGGFVMPVVSLFRIGYTL